MITIRNCLNQPLPVDLGDGTSIHFGPKEEQEIDEMYLEAPEVKKHLDLLNIMVVKA